VQLYVLKCYENLFRYVIPFYSCVFKLVIRLINYYFKQFKVVTKMYYYLNTFSSCSLNHYDFAHSNFKFNIKCNKKFVLSLTKKKCCL